MSKLTNEEVNQLIQYLNNQVELDYEKRRNKTSQAKKKEIKQQPQTETSNYNMDNILFKCVKCKQSKKTSEFDIRGSKLMKTCKMCRKN
jgi:hypothetical protein